jgi:hypothetical protein
MKELAALPDRPRLRAQILLGDLAALRRAYQSRPAFRQALAGVWLPDALAGAFGGRWRVTFGFDIEDVQTFAAAGFHPRETVVMTGTFAPGAVRRALLRRGYRELGSLLSLGGDGSIDPSTPAGRLVLSALDRVEVTSRHLRAASTANLAEDTGAPSRSMAANPDLAAAARALGRVTAAVIKPARLILPPAGVPVTPIVNHRARWVAAGADDRGAGDRTVKIVLVYARRAQAREDAAVLRQRLAGTPVLNSPDTRFGQILEGLTVRVSGERAVLVTGRLPPDAEPGLWRSLVEAGDLSVLIALA